jgi:hypothetical protein
VSTWRCDEEWEESREAAAGDQRLEIQTLDERERRLLIGYDLS